MSYSRPHDETGEIEALTGQTEVDEAASPDEERPAVEPTVEDGGVDAEREVDVTSDETEPETDGDDAELAGTGLDDTDDTGQPVEEAGTGTGDTSDDPKLDAPD
ncbi:hypothetical protein GCM10009846_28600 [Agrococcus versicolor]|uniref:Sugar ABC transporter ATPase n=1 Tax=Agrococcus versicolor TaxID=501482 RepID=A0ABN3AXA1_9MICO